MAQLEFTAIEKTILIVGILSTLGSFIYEIWRRLRIVFKGKQSLPFDRLGARLWRVFKEVFLHEKVIRDRFWPGFRRRALPPARIEADIPSHAQSAEDLMWFQSFV